VKIFNQSTGPWSGGVRRGSAAARAVSDDEVHFCDFVFISVFRCYRGSEMGSHFVLGAISRLRWGYGLTPDFVFNPGAFR